MVVGIAGKYCSGKSTLTQILIEHGFTEINLDKVGHLCLRMYTGEVIKAFGREIADENGDISREKLGEIVFRDPNKRRQLESIIHPRMVDYVLQNIHTSRERNTVIDGALLFSMGLDSSCSFAFWVRAPILHRFIRAFRRDRLSFRNIFSRFWTQRKLRPHGSLKDVDIYYIWNTGPHNKLKRRIEEILLERGIG